MLNPVLSNHIERVRDLCSKYNVKKLYVFGSVCTSKFSPESDIDFIVDFKEELDPLTQGESWWALFYELKDLFKREIDLVVEKSLKNPFLLKEIGKTKSLIYG